MKRGTIVALLFLGIIIGLGYGLAKAADFEVILGTSSGFNIVRGTSVSAGTSTFFVGSSTVSIGTTTQAAMLTIAGSSTSGSETSLSVKNSSGADSLYVRNDGAILIGTNTSQLNSSLYVGSTTSGSLGTTTAGFLSVGTVSANTSLHGTTTVRFLDNIYVNGTVTAAQGIMLGDGTSLTTTKQPYIQLSDSTNQAPGTTSPVLVTFNTLDEQETFSFSPTSGTVTVPTSGVYFIMAGGQVGETSNANVNVDMWFRKNSVDIANSNVRNFLTETLDTKVVVSQAAIRLAAGDTIKVYISVSLTTAGAGLRVTNPSGEPRIPSIIFTMYKISY